MLRIKQSFKWNLNILPQDFSRKLKDIKKFYTDIQPGFTRTELQAYKL